MKPQGKDKKFKFKVEIEVAQLWIEDGVTSVTLKERMQKLLEDLIPHAYHSEVKVTVK